MRRLQLAPERHDVPTCDDFTSEEAVRRYEREVRVHRAYTEPVTVTPLEARVDGAYRVSGASGSAYLIDIVGGDGPSDACTCPDFLGNQLGTCKHLEAVRRAIASRRSLRSALARLGDGPAGPVLTVDATAGLVLHGIGPWPAAVRRKYEKLISAGEPGEALCGGRHPNGVRVVHAAAEALARLAGKARRVERHGALAAVDPDVLKRPLFPYQREGVTHLVRSGRALLADDMGLGKTVQAIGACEVLRRRGEAARILVVTAASIKHQWVQEIARYAGEQAVVVAGGAAERRRALESGAAYTILNYEQTWRELTLIRRLSADVLILDEAQRAKNFRTKTAATLRAIPSRFLFILTGTPIENRLDDLYSLMQLVDPEVLGPLWRFNLDFHTQNARGRVTGYKNLSALRERVAPVVLRRRKEQVLLELPDLIEQTRYTPLTKEQAELDAGYRADAASLMAIAERRPLRKPEQDRLMACLLKARQACNAVELCDPKRKPGGSPKLDEFEALVSEIAAEEGRKILVFSEWVEMLKLAAARLDRLGVRHEMLHGGVPTEQRPALLERFRTDPEVRVLLSSDAGGVGLNLQVASSVIHLELPWNPARLDQRTARAYRLGQTRGVVVTYLCSEQGIERGMEGTLRDKRAVSAAALSDGGADAMAAPSFSVFVRQVRETLEQLESPRLRSEDADDEAAALPASPVAPPLLPSGDAPAIAAAPTDVAPPPPDPAPAPTEPKQSAAGPTVPETASVSAPASTSEPASRPEAPSSNRLRLARLVLDAGFFGDAVGAAYEALAAAVGGLGSGPPPEGHAPLVALIYRELLPGGKLPAAAHATFARLHDLTSLERSGVAIDAALAREAVAEAETWVARLAGDGAGP